MEDGGKIARAAIATPQPVEPKCPHCGAIANYPHRCNLQDENAALRAILDEALKWGINAIRFDAATSRATAEKAKAALAAPQPVEREEK
jgi:hypothetical protein